MALELNLYKLMVVYVFGDFFWAIFGFLLILFAISFLGKWSPNLRIVFMLLFLYFSLAAYHQVFAVILWTLAMMGYVVGIFNFIRIRGY